jgi:hypothetical protein
VNNAPLEASDNPNFDAADLLVQRAWDRFAASEPSEKIVVEICDKDPSV